MKIEYILIPFSDRCRRKDPQCKRGYIDADNYESAFVKLEKMFCIDNKIFYSTINCTNPPRVVCVREL